MSEKDYICKSELLARGWTDSLIRDFYPHHDKEKTNPHYRNATPMKLYRLSKVKVAEMSDKFKERLKGAEKRKASARKAVQTKWEQTDNVLNNFSFDIPDIPKERIFQRAVNHYNDLWAERGCYDKYISHYSCLDDDTLERLTANYVRHIMTDYDKTLNELSGKVGANIAHSYLQETINRKVHEKYFAA